MLSLGVLNPLDSNASFSSLQNEGTSKLAEPVMPNGRHSLENSDDSISDEPEETFEGTVSANRNYPVVFIGAESLVSEKLPQLAVSILCPQLFGIKYLPAEEVCLSALNGKPLSLHKDGRTFSLTFKHIPGATWSAEEIQSCLASKQVIQMPIDPSDSETVSWAHEAICPKHYIKV